MTTCLERGMKLAQAFIEDCLVCGESQERPFKSFYDPVSRSGIKTFSNMKKKISVHTKHISMDGEMMYLRLMAVNVKKKVPAT